MNLRTETFAFSKRSGDKTEYSVVHKGEKSNLGTVYGLPAYSIPLYMSSRYGYEGDNRNLGSSPVYFHPDTGENEEVEKVNPILGQYEFVNTELISPPPDNFGVEVAVDQSMLISGTLPNSQTFNKHTGLSGDIGAFLGVDLSTSTLLPISIR